MHLTVRCLALLTFAVAGLSLSIPACNAQVGNQSNPECTAADLDATFAFARTDDHYESIIFQVKNISNGVCTVRGGPGASFNDFRHGHNIWTESCFECGSTGDSNMERFSRVLELAPGAQAYRVDRWASSLIDAKSPCQEADGINTYVNSDMQHQYLIIAPTLITNVCSTVDVSGYRAGLFGEPDATIAATEPILGTEKIINYPGELIVLHVAADNQGPLDKNSCPILFFRTRSERGDTRFEERFSRGACAGKVNSAGMVSEDLAMTSGFGLAGAGSYSLDVSQLVGRSVAGMAVMRTSKPLQLHFADEASIKRDWSPIEDGIAIALNPDRDTYRVGQDIHLHVATQDFHATKTLYVEDCIRPVTIEVRDSLGNPIKSKGPTAGYPTLEILRCSGGRTMAFPKGKPVAWEPTLRELGILPDYAGEFTVVATWSALAESEAQIPPAGTVFLGRRLENYSVIRSLPVIFRIIEK
jgi:hypothetical protein